MSTTDTEQQQRSYGARARLGLIVPTTNTVNEAEWSVMTGAMEGVSFHTARMPLHAAGENDGPEGLPQVLADAMAQLTPAQLGCVAYSCTAGSMVNPVESLPATMQSVAEVPCTSTAAAIVAALDHLDVKRVAVATPYHEAVNEQWRSFLEGCGFAVSDIRGLGIGAGGPHEFSLIATLTAAAVEEHAMSVCAGGAADALLLSCTDMATLHMIPRLEERLGIPVVTSNTATLWRSLQLAGAPSPIAEAGRLMQLEHP